MSHFDGITIRETNHFSKYKPKHTYRTISPLHLLSIVNISAPVEHSITSLTYPKTKPYITIITSQLILGHRVFQKCRFF